MKLVDTTNPIANVGVRMLFSDVTASRALDMASRLRLRLLGLYYSEFGGEWSSGGRRECDYLHHIDIVLAGRRQVVWEDRVLDLKPGMAYFLPGYVPVERRCRERCKVLFVKFRYEWLPGVDPLLDWPERCPTLIGPFDARSWSDRCKHGWTPDANQLMRLQADIEVWMAKILPDVDELISRHLATHAPFEKVFNLVEEKMGADLRVEDLARSYGTSLHAFSMAFARNTGTNPKEYLNRRLNQEAIQLVINTDMKMREIADQLRFADEYYFNRFFSKANGCPPMQYRQRFRTGVR